MFCIVDIYWYSFYYGSLVLEESYLHYIHIYIAEPSSELFIVYNGIVRDEKSNIFNILYIFNGEECVYIQIYNIICKMIPYIQINTHATFQHT